MSAVLGFSFRWVFQMPDIGVTYDSDGRPHSGIFVFNSGDAPARGVRFVGGLALVAGREVWTATDLTDALSRHAWSVPQSCHPTMPPLFSPLSFAPDERDPVGARVTDLHAFGRVVWTGGREDFCCRWDGATWHTVEVVG